MYNMPARRRGGDLGRQTKNSRLQKIFRAQRSVERIQQDKEKSRIRIAQIRASQSQEERDERNRKNRLQQRAARRLEKRKESKQQKTHGPTLPETYGPPSASYIPPSNGGANGAECCFGGEENIPIIKMEFPDNIDGFYKYEYETGNGINIEETDYLKNDAIKIEEAEVADYFS